MRIRKRSACISAGFGASHGAAVPKVQTLNISVGHSFLSSGDASKLDTQESQKQIVENHDLSPGCDRNLERTAAIAEQADPSHRFDTTGSSPGGNHHHAAKDVFQDFSPWMPSHSYRLLKLHGYSASLNLHHVSANMQAEKATLLQTDSLPAESCITRDQLENGSFNSNTPVCSIESTVATRNKQGRIQGEECVNSGKKDQAMITARQPKCDDNGKVGMLTTPRSTPQLLNDEVSISTLAKGDYMDNSSFMFIDKKKLGIIEELQQMAINDHAAKLRILGKGKGDLKQINVDRISATHDENEVKQDQGEIEAKQDQGEIEVKQDQGACKEKRCSRKGGGGWQCKNMRPGDGSSVYCDYHQVLTSAQHRATLNARSKTLKENNRKKGCIVAGKSDQPLQNMVDVKLLQLPFLPSKEHTYEDVKADDTVSSMGDKRTFQEAGCAEKQQPFNRWILKDDVEPEANSVALPRLVEADLPKTQHTHQEADSKLEGCSLNFRKRRAGNATVVLEAAGCSILNIMMNAEECATGEILGATDATVGKIHKSDDGIENSNEVEEVMRCKQIDGRGVQCTKRSSMFCEYHFNERLCQKIIKEPTLNDSKHTLSLKNINLSSTGTYSDALTVIGPRSNVQDKNSSDANKHSPVGMANATNVVGGSHVKSSVREKKSVHVRQTLDRDQEQNASIHKKHDKSVNELHQQLQEQQLLWWQCKQHDKDGVVNTERNTGEQPQLDTLPRRSERKLIIDICKATAAEKPSKNLNVEVTQFKLLQNLSKPSNILSAVEHSTSIEPMDKIDAVPPVLHTNESSRLDLTQEQRCKRHDGRGWQCKIMCAQGKLYCEHHLKLRQSYIDKAGVETNNRLQTQPCKEENNVIRTSKYPAKMANGHGNKKQMQHVIMQAGHDKWEAVHAPQKEHDEQMQQCGRHDGRGWQCKSKCRQGSIYCEYHQEKLRLNHATWNAKVKLLQQRKKEEAYIHNRLEKQEQSRKRSMVETTKEGTKTPLTGSLYPTKKKMRSLKEIEACAIT